jgi:hypothetical protein
VAKKQPLEANGLLFASLAEQVKLPFVQIAHAAELLQLRPSPAELERLLSTISLTSDAALKLIDGYLLSVQLQQTPGLPLEPVSLSSVLYDTAEGLSDYARAHDCELELQLQGKYGPVMARHDVLKSALLSLGYAFIEAVSRPDARTTLSLVARRTARGMSAGIFSSQEGLSKGLFKQGKQLQGIARQPLSDFSAGSGAGIFVADSLLSHLDSPLRVARFRAQTGLAATLIPSFQLSLV